MIRRQYLLISCVFMIFIVYLYSHTLMNDLSSKLYSKIESQIIQNKNKIGIENNAKTSMCYRATDRKVCANYNGIYFNKSKITYDELQILENKIHHKSENGLYFDSRFFDNTVNNSVDDSCKHGLELIYCELALRYNRKWACNFEMSNSSQYLDDQRIYYQEVSYFKDHIRVPMDVQEKMYLEYIQNLKIFDETNGDIDYNIYNEKYIFPPEPNMIKIAYTLLINAPSKESLDFILLRFQLSALARKNATIIVIHVDQNIDDASFGLIKAEVEEFINRGHNIFLLPYRYKHIPGTSSQMYIQLSCFAYLFQLEQDNADLRWDFVINLSQNDFPIKSIQHIQKHLFDHRVTHMEHYKATAHDLSQRHHARRLQVKCEDHIVSANLELEEIIKNVEFPVHGSYVNTTTPYLKDYYKGSEWFIMAKQHALYILKNVDRNLMLSVKHTFSPHETVFHTLLVHSDYSQSLSKNIYRITGLSAGPVTASNQILSMKHFEMLKISKALLARKVVDLDLAENILTIIK